MNIAANDSPKPATHVAFFPGIEGARIEFNADDFDAVLPGFVAKHPGNGAPKVEPIKDPAIAKMGEVKAFANPVMREALGSYPSAVFEQAALDRVTSQHSTLAFAGVTVDSRTTFGPLGATGKVSSAHLLKAQEHDRRMPLRDAAEQLAERVRGEARSDETVTARELASKVEVNGRLTLAGMTLQEQAIRGLLGRVDSPALSYVFGLRDRIADRVREARTIDADPKGSAASVAALHAASQADKRELAHVLSHELGQAGDVQIKLRTRRIGEGRDVFAAVSTRYEPADAPEVIAQILKAMPADAKGSWSYDPVTTTWEVRAELWTPTPAAEHAVGEAFRGYVSFRSRDNGTGSLKGGGGIEILACLNSATYVANGVEVNRRHIGAIVAEAEKMVAKARTSIDALCAAWGVAREEVIDLPSDLEALVGLPISKAIPGFWWGTLGDRKGELAGVLPGRTKDHVQGLTAAYFSERRDPERVVRADFAQAWTRYIQAQPTDVRRDAEAAGAAWLVSGRPVRFDADRVTA